MTAWRCWPGFGALFAVAVMMVPGAARAQTADDVIGVRDAIRAELARPGSGIVPTSILVSNVRFEGEFATADVAGANFASPIVFVRQVDGRWQVVLVGTEMTPEDCRYIGFPAGSQMCRN